MSEKYDARLAKMKLVQRQINSTTKFNHHFGKWWDDQNVEWEVPEQDEEVITLTEEVYNDKNINRS